MEHKMNTAAETKRNWPAPGAAVTRNSKSIWWLGIAGGAALAVLTLAGVFMVARGDGNSPLAQLKRALEHAEPIAPLSGYPAPPWANPYARVLKVLRTERRQLPKRWQARAWAQYAVYIGELAPQNGRPHGHRWYRRREKAILLHAVAICPAYASGWAQLASLYWLEAFHAAGKPSYRRYRAAFHHYLAAALRASALNPYANALRALDIDEFSRASGPYTGNLHFRPAKWSRAFCYRALVSLRYAKGRSPLGFARFKGSSATVGGLAWSDSYFFRPALKYYEPKQLAELDAGVWKPGPCPDPWPPPEKKAVNAPPTASATRSTR